MTSCHICQTGKLLSTNIYCILNDSLFNKRSDIKKRDFTQATYKDFASNTLVQETLELAKSRGDAV